MATLVTSADMQYKLYINDGFIYSLLKPSSVLCFKKTIKKRGKCFSRGLRFLNVKDKMVVFVHVLATWTVINDSCTLVLFSRGRQQKVVYDFWEETSLLKFSNVFLWLWAAQVESGSIIFNRRSPKLSTGIEQTSPWSLTETSGISKVTKTNF